MNDPRKLIEEIITIKLDKSDNYRHTITMGQLLEVADQTDLMDRIIRIDYEIEETTSFMNDEEMRYYTPILVVGRKRLENDDEYLKRQEEETSRIKAQEEADRLTYLRLKAKFESK
ncbi:hypothetical protein M0Q50_08605 [bacterium]|jgi:hypothetical protein|nr:hypothetical protein [bacterium]